MATYVYTRILQEHMHVRVDYDTKQFDMKRNNAYKIAVAINICAFGYVCTE